MSLLICVYVNEGMVLASDRRTTMTNIQTVGNEVIQRIGIHKTDSTDKTFICPNGAGISACGDADLCGKPIGGYIKEFIRTKIDKHCPVSSIPQMLIDHFNSFSKTPDATFIVAGYEGGGTKKKHLVYELNVMGKWINERAHSFYGALWEGETQTLTRLINDGAYKDENGVYYDYQKEIIPWESFTLQDAVDFARYAIETTVQTMRFKNLVKTVGGAIDILVITPERTEWLQKEQLR